MKAAIVVSARMTSSRLPGKMLKLVGNRPLLGYLIDRLKDLSSSLPIIVATSVRDEDVPIYDYCKKMGVECYRGDLENVYARYCNLITHYQLDAFVRVTGDSPLMDPFLVKKAWDLFLENKYELVTNVFPRSFPKGMSVEVFKSHTFKEAEKKLTTAAQREHISSFFYENFEQYKIGNFSSLGNFQELQLSIDTPEDLTRMSKILLGDFGPINKLGWKDLVDIYRETEF